MIEYRQLRLITYGCGHVFDRAKFKPIKNLHVKPRGGLWASPADSGYGWKQWCETEEFNVDKLACSFEFIYAGRTLVIDRLHDLRDMKFQPFQPFLLYARSRACPDYEAMITDGVDAIYLTERGQRETSYSVPANLYGYDCESVLVMNPDCIEVEQCLRTDCREVAR